jgi:hypothetical protein
VNDARVAHHSLAIELRRTVIGIPARALDPATHEIISPRNVIGVAVRVTGDQGEDLVAQLARTSFIGIEAEDPIAGAGIGRPIAQFAESRERYLYHARAQPLGDGHGGVGAVGIGDDDFIRPQHGCDGVGDLFGLIQGNHGGRYFGHARRAHVSGIPQRTVSAKTAKVLRRRNLPGSCGRHNACDRGCPRMPRLVARFVNLKGGKNL